MFVNQGLELNIALQDLYYFLELFIVMIHHFILKPYFRLSPVRCLVFLIIFEAFLSVLVIVWVLDHWVAIWSLVRFDEILGLGRGLISNFKKSPGTGSKALLVPFGWRSCSWRNYSKGRKGTALCSSTPPSCFVLRTKNAYYWKDP